MADYVDVPHDAVISAAVKLLGETIGLARQQPGLDEGDHQMAALAMAMSALIAAASREHAAPDGLIADALANVTGSFAAQSQNPPAALAFIADCAEEVTAVHLASGVGHTPMAQH